MKGPPFDGELTTDERRRAEAGRDFGGLVARLPRAVLYPRSTRDVVRAIDFAKQQGIRVAARGQGHCTRGQAQVEDGLVIDTRWLDQIEVGSGWAAVGAGCLWSTLLRHTLETGQTPPTLTDYLGLSVGGTLSVGGVGGQSFRFGMQTDNVEALTVVTGAGELLECSRDEHADLFHGCRGGLGQFGIIVAARIKLQPAPKRVAVYQLEYPDAESFLTDQETHLVDGRFDYVLGSVLPRASGWGFVVEVVKYFDSPSDFDERRLVSGLACQPSSVARREQDFFAYANRLEEVVEQMKGSATVSPFHPWMDLFVGARSIRELLDFALQEFRPAQLTDGYVMTYPLVRGVSDTPFLGLPDEAHCYLFDVLPHMSGDDQAGLATFASSCRRVFQRACELGASVYPIGYPVGEMGEGHWRRQLGASWDAMVTAKAKFDPERILAPEPRVFPLAAQ